MRPRDENHGDQAVIAAPGIDSFREFVLFAQNGIRLLDAAGNLIKTAEQEIQTGMARLIMRIRAKRATTIGPSDSSTAYSEYLPSIRFLIPPSTEILQPHTASLYQ
ncbi:MAG: hypothetical protein ACLR23_15980 [Clostridia bacterium]